MVLVLEMPKKRLQEGFNLHVDVGMYTKYQSEFSTIFDSLFVKYKPEYKNNIVMFNDFDCLLLFSTLYYINKFVLRATEQEMLDFKDSFNSKVAHRLSKISSSFNKHAFKKDFQFQNIPNIFLTVFPNLNENVTNTDEQVLDSPTTVSVEQFAELPIDENLEEESIITEQVVELPTTINHNVELPTTTINPIIEQVPVEQIVDESTESIIKKQVESAIQILHTQLEIAIKKMFENQLETIENRLETNIEKILGNQIEFTIQKVLGSNLESNVEKTLDTLENTFSKLEERLTSTIVENLEANVVENLEEKYNSIVSNQDNSEIITMLQELKEKMVGDEVDEKVKSKINVLEMENSELRRENEEIFEKLNECEKQFNVIKEKYKTLQQIKRKYKTMVLNGASINHIEQIQSDEHSQQRSRKNFVSPIPNEPYREYYKR